MKRVIPAFAIVGALVAGCIYYFFGVVRPRQASAEAREEITAWEERYAAARECILGKQPASSKTSEALAIREMNGDTRSLKTCTPLVGHLARNGTIDTAIDDVEAAWTALDRAATHAANAYATHVATTVVLAKDDPLPGALDALDAARVALRAAADMPPLAPVGPALPVADIAPFPDVDGQRVDTLELAGVPSAHGVVAFGKTAKGGDVQVVLAPGARPIALRVAPGGVRGVPDTSWGAIGLADGTVLVGAMTSDGAIAQPTKLALVPAGAKGTTVVTHGSTPTMSIAAVAGSLDHGVVVYGDAIEVGIARVEHGVATAEPARSIDVAIAAADVDGRAAAAWAYHGRSVARLIAADAFPIDLPAGPIAQLCLTRDQAWLDNVHFGSGAPGVIEQLPFHELVGCTADAAIQRGRSSVDELDYAVCTPKCRSPIHLAGAPERAAITVVDGKLVAIASYAGVLGVWREDAPPSFFALPRRVRPVLAHEWPAAALTDGKTIDIVARGDDRFVVIRIPARPAK